MSGNSSTQLQQIVDFAKTLPELNPILSTGGFSDQPARSIANRVMIDMLAARFPWKWNRFKIPPVYTNSWQQDYALQTMNNLAWFENGVIVDINSTSQPKTKYPFEANRDLAETDVQYGQPGQFSWMPNDQLIYGTWGGGNIGEGTLSNPGASSVYGPILGTTSQAANPFTQVKDPNGNLWTLQPSTAFPNNLTQKVTLGATQPVWPANPVFPTFQNPNVSPSTIADGTATWQAVNPKGQGIRINPIPSQTGRVWQLRTFAQMRPPQFLTLTQTLEPIPDDFYVYFQDGFVAYCYLHSKDSKIAAKFQKFYQLWITSLQNAIMSQDRERDNTGIYPSEAIMQQRYLSYLGPANPYLI
ncbi:MAG: hypothetical protein ACREQ5_06890 [Candidatus Dormibacteria bacterium]